MDIINLIKNCHISWQNLLLSSMEPYKDDINKLLDDDEVYPCREHILRCFNMFAKDDLKVVILGQDAYHSKSKNNKPLADGLCFSVPQDCVKCPPSLRNIFKELYHEYGIMRTNTDLSDWSEQGVLLLNCALSVRGGKPASHLKVWKPFIEDVIKRISIEHKNIVYILWGTFAQNFIKFIDNQNNLILVSRHPSPLAMNSGPFIGNMHFRQTNDYLKKYNKSIINWV